MLIATSKRPFVLIVDDEPEVLLAMKLRLQTSYVVVTARDAEEALERARTGSFQVVLADMNMPGMGGTKLLEQFRTEIPDCSRILVTASSDLRQVIDAVNRGDLFRFVAKPFDSAGLLETVEEGVQESKRRVTERNLLSGTLEPGLQVLVDLMSIQRPKEFGRAAAIADKARTLATELKIADTWEVGIAASLHCIGTMCVPDGIESSEDELAQIGFDLLNPIPRLGEVARILRYQHQAFDGSELPADGVSGEQLPLGARILKVAMAVNDMCSEGMQASAIFQTLEAANKQFDPRITAAARRCLRPLIGKPDAKTNARRIITLSQLLPGHILLEDLSTTDGVLLMAAGRRVTQTMLESIRQYARLKPVHEPLVIATPENET